MMKRNNNMTKSNLDIECLDSIIKLSNDIYNWLVDKDHPENYEKIDDLSLVRDFIHLLDLLETILMQFSINAYLSKKALLELSKTERNTIGWEFWQIDIEQYFSASSLELVYQLSNGWKKIDKYANKHSNFRILKTKYEEPSNISIARHKTTHFQPEDFQNHKISSIYSILRRPYQIKDGKLVKELAKETMPKVASLIIKSIDECFDYLSKFKKATIG